MKAISNLKGIEDEERNAKLDRHAILLLLVKPSDELSSGLIEQFNYYHFAAGQSCTIYAPGYTTAKLADEYMPMPVARVNGSEWYFSDRCFAEFLEQLENRLKWQYCGELEILILQSSSTGQSSLDFRNYVSLDVMRGLRERYFDSPQRLVQELINASRTEVDAKRLLEKSSRLSATDIAKQAIECASPLPDPIKQLFKDRLFYRTASRKTKQTRRTSRAEMPRENPQPAETLPVGKPFS